MTRAIIYLLLVGCLFGAFLQLVKARAPLSVRIVVGTVMASPALLIQFYPEIMGRWVLAPLVLLSLFGVLGMIGGILLWFALLFYGSLQLRWSLLDHLKRGLSLDEIDEAMPDPVADAAASFERLGFDHLIFGRIPQGDEYEILFRAHDALLAEVCRQPAARRSAEQLILAITSELEIDHGSFCTTTSGIGLHKNETQLWQVFPGAIPKHLLEQHQLGLQFLRDKGIDVVAYPRDEALDRWSRAGTEHFKSALRASRWEMIMAVVRIVRKDHEHVGQLKSNPEMIERLAPIVRRSQPST